MIPNPGTGEREQMEHRAYQPDERKIKGVIVRLLRKLCFITISQAEYLEDRHEAVMAQLERLDTVFSLRYKRDDQGLSDLKRDFRPILGDDDFIGLFDSSAAARLGKAYDAFTLRGPAFGSAEKRMQFQLAVASLRLCFDYRDATDLYSRHSDGFQQQSPFILRNNDVTGEIDWMGSRDATIILLEKNFRERYEAAESKKGAFFKKTKLANEALVIARRVIRDSPGLMSAHSQAPGMEFQRACGDRLEALGFSVEYTNHSGDLRVDIIAWKDGVKYALQCQDGGSPAGIKAVNKAASGRQYYHAHYAAVVARNGFTPAATEFADATKVFLLTSSTLGDIEVLVRGKTP